MVALWSDEPTISEHKLHLHACDAAYHTYFCRHWPCMSPSEVKGRQNRVGDLRDRCDSEAHLCAVRDEHLAFREVDELGVGHRAVLKHVVDRSALRGTLGRGGNCDNSQEASVLDRRIDGRAGANGDFGDLVWRAASQEGRRTINIDRVCHADVIQDV